MKQYSKPWDCKRDDRLWTLLQFTPVQGCRGLCFYIKCYNDMLGDFVSQDVRLKSVEHRKEKSAHRGPAEMSGRSKHFRLFLHHQRLCSCDMQIGEGPSGWLVIPMIMLFYCLLHSFPHERGESGGVSTTWGLYSSQWTSATGSETHTPSHSAHSLRTWLLMLSGPVELFSLPGVSPHPLCQKGGYQVGEWS